MANTTIGTLAISVKANVDKAVKGFRKANKSVKSFSDAVGVAKVAVAAFATAAAYKSFNTVASAVDNATKRIDALAKTSAKLGLATEQLAGLRLAAELSGVGISQLDTGIQRMVRRVSEAAIGIGEARGALAELNLDAVALSKLSPDQQFRRIADAFEGIDNQADRVRLAFKLFDTEGVALVNTMRGGSAALLATQRQAEKLGLAVSSLDAAKVEALNDATLRVERAFEGLSNSFTVAFAPAIESFANKASDAVTDLASNAAALALAQKAAEQTGNSWLSVTADLFLGLSDTEEELLGVAKATSTLTAAQQAAETVAKRRAEQIAKENKLLKEQRDLRIAEFTASTDAMLEKRRKLLDDQQESIENITQALKEQAFDVALSDRERLEFDLLDLKATPAQVAEALRVFDSIAETAAKNLKMIEDEANKVSLDAFADSLLDSIKSPTEALEDFISEIESLGDRLTAFQKDQLISNKYDELFGDTFKQSTPQSPAALQQGTAEARSAELAAINRISGDQSAKQQRDKMLKALNDHKREAQETNDYLSEIVGLGIFGITVVDG